MTIKRKVFDKGVKIKQDDLTANPLTEQGEIGVDSNDGKLKYKDGSATRTIVGTNDAQTLTNKTINSASNTLVVDADTATVSNLEVDNLKSGVLDTDISTTSGSHDTIPSAKAVKDYVDAQILTKDAASEIAFTDSPSFPGTPANVQDALNELNDKVDANATSGSGDLSSHISDVSTHGISVAIVGTTETQTLTNKTLTSPIITGASIQTPSRLDMKQDTEANLTTYAATASNGQLVFATDTKKVYQVKDTLLAEIGGGGSGGTSIEITQTAHGFAVGDGIYHNGTNWVKAQANAIGTLARFTVFSVPSANQFVAYSFGRVTVTAHGFTVGNFYYLSPSTAGLPTLTEPTSASHYSNPLFFVESANILIAFVYRPLKAATNLDDLSDVSTSGATNGQALIFNGSSWSPADVVQNAGDVVYDNSSSGLTSIDVQSAIDEIDVDVDDLNTLSGVAKNAQNLGTFTGTTIADNTTIKPALQSLETAQESTASSLSSHIASTSTHGVSGAIVGTTDAQTLTNKTVNDNTFTIQDNTDNTKKLQFEASAISASTTRTLTAPNANTTIVGTDIAQVITLKDIDGGTASNTNRITIPKDTRANLDSLTRKAGTILFDTTNDNPVIDNGTGLIEIDTNTSIKNYIKYSNGDRGLTGWTGCVNTAQTTPGNTFTGTPNSTFTRSGTAPLRGAFSFLLTHNSGANRQGEEYFYDFTIDAADKNNILEISFDYDASDANYLDDYYSIFIYDVTNSQLIRFNGEELKGKTNGKFLAFFQASQSTSYRLIIHTVTTSTTQFSVKFDNFSVGPSKDIGLANTNITAWTSYTPTFTGFGTATSIEFQWRRIGEDVEIRGKFTSGTSTATEARVSLPNGFTSSGTSKIPSLQIAGMGTRDTNSSGPLSVLIEPSVTYVTFGYANLASTNMLTKYNGSAIISSGEKFSFFGKLPVTAFTAVDTTSAEYSGRFHSCNALLTSNQTISATGYQKITINTSDVNTTGMMNTSSNRVDILESGYYNISASAMLTSFTANINVGMALKKTGSFFSPYSKETNVTTATTAITIDINVNSTYLVKGDYIEFFAVNGSDSSYTVESGYSWFNITKIANPVDVVKSNETVFLDAAGNGGGSPTGSSGNIDFTEITDSHGAWDGTTFTVPVSGDYSINASIKYSASVAGRAIYLYVNGSLARTICYSDASLQIYTNNIVYRLVKGQTVNIRHSNTQALSNDTNSHWLTIRKFN